MIPLTPLLKRSEFTQDLLDKLERVGEASEDGGYWQKAVEFVRSLPHHYRLSLRQHNWLIEIVDDLGTNRF